MKCHPCEKNDIQLLTSVKILSENDIQLLTSVKIKSTYFWCVILISKFAAIKDDWNMSFFSYKLHNVIVDNKKFLRILILLLIVALKASLILIFLACACNTIYFSNFPATNILPSCDCSCKRIISISLDQSC